LKLEGVIDVYNRALMDKTKTDWQTKDTDNNGLEECFIKWRKFFYSQGNVLGGGNCPGRGNIWGMSREMSYILQGYRV